MHTEKSANDRDRIERFLRLTTAPLPWSVDDAKAKLTKIMKQASEGRPQVVGIRKQVLMIGGDWIKELERILSGPETWGEYFATPYDGEESDVVLAVPSDGGQAMYSLDTDDVSEPENGDEFESIIEIGGSVYRLTAPAEDEIMDFIDQLKGIVITTAHTKPLEDLDVEQRHSLNRLKLRRATSEATEPEAVAIKNKDAPASDANESLDYQEGEAG